MQYGITLGYLSYFAVFLILTGAGILLLDARRYRVEGMRKEAKASRFCGWFNLVLGVLLIAGNTMLPVVM